MTYPVERIQTFADDHIEAGQRAVTKFQTAMTEDPVYAFSWGRDAMLGAARLQVGQAIKAHLDHGIEKGLDMNVVGAAIIERAIDMVLRKAEVSESTSHTSNYMERYVTQVWSDLAKKAFDFARYDQSKKGVERTVGFGTTAEYTVK